MIIKISLRSESPNWWEAKALGLPSKCFAFGYSREEALQNLLGTILLELALQTDERSLRFVDGLSIEFHVVG